VRNGRSRRRAWAGVMTSSSPVRTNPAGQPSTSTFRTVLPAKSRSTALRAAATADAEWATRDPRNPANWTPARAGSAMPPGRFERVTANVSRLRHTSSGARCRHGRQHAETGPIRPRSGRSSSRRPSGRSSPSANRTAELTADRARDRAGLRDRQCPGRQASLGGCGITRGSWFVHAAVSMTRVPLMVA
jgi:hypothetical protein